VTLAVRNRRPIAAHIDDRADIPDLPAEVPALATWQRCGPSCSDTLPLHDRCCVAELAACAGVTIYGERTIGMPLSRGVTLDLHRQLLDR